MRHFEFDVHFDGAFAWPPLRYERDVVVPIVINQMGYDDLVEYLERVCDSAFNGLYFLLPSKELNDGLLKIEGQSEIDMLFDIAYSYGKLHISGPLS